MIPFEQFWILHNPSAEYAHMHRFCKKIWEELPEQKQELIYRTVEYKKKNKLFVDYNPYYAMQKNAVTQQTQPKTLSFADYYKKYGTTEELDGWHMANPTGQKVIYVKP